MDIVELLTAACEAGASDLHLSAGEPPRVRIDGEIKCFRETPVSAEASQAMVCSVMTDAQRRKFDEISDLDFSYEIESLSRFRVNVYRTRLGVGGAFRMIPNHVKTIDELGLPPVLKQLCGMDKGLVLVTGPTGSGKSTTQAAMIDHINSTTDGHILTIEDPIEFVHESRGCLINQREVGTHTSSFAAALRGALREDPDVILVGEMRDLETMSLAITAAETGHLVLATLHTSSAAKTVHRLIDVFPPEQQEQIRIMFSDSMLAILCQSLLRKRTGGRVAAMEILLGTPAVRNLIREGKAHQIPSAMQTGKNFGMQTMDGSLLELVRSGTVSAEQAKLHASAPELFGGPGAAQPERPTPAGRPTPLRPS
jgi:twitching motility protein PilT